MTALFRGIRRRLLGSRRTRRYLQYAAGEVVLVVVGILIALQLNSWREARKDRAFELTMLREIHGALALDTDFLRSLHERLDRSNAGSERALRLVVGDASLDSLAEAIGQSRTWIQLSFNRGPYDALRSTGIDKVANDSLRAALVRLYDYRFPRAEQFLGGLSARRVDLDVVHDALFTPVVSNGPDGSLQVTRQLTANREDRMANIPLLVASRRATAQEARFRLTPLLEEAEHLLEVLGAELASRGKRGFFRRMPGISEMKP